MKLAALALAALGPLLAGYFGGQAQTETLVRQVTIDGESVVLERCRVRARSNLIAVGRCWRDRLPLPVVTRVERVAAPTAECAQPREERARIEPVPPPARDTAAA